MEIQLLDFSVHSIVKFNEFLDSTCSGVQRRSPDMGSEVGGLSYNNKKLSYRRETARQLCMST